ncbi:ZIP family metal transporter [Candidatus Woesearchaeota archaeon]|nr:ZIP family metal transporter [Candidatus Woesearchaeota archaeon]
MEINTFAWITIFAVSSAVINSIGIFFVYKHNKWTSKIKAYFMCFAAGVLISTPLILVLPNAVKLHPYAGVFALIGFLFMFLSNELIKRKTRQQSLAFGITAVEGIGIHSFIDGLVYTVTFSASLLIGFLSGIGLVVHEFAEGVITFSVLMKTSVGKKKAAFYAFITAALTTPLGAFIAYPSIRKLDSSFLGLALGFVCGVLIYVSAAHLLPEAREHEKKHSIWAFLAGVTLALFIVFTKIVGG